MVRYKAEKTPGLTFAYHLWFLNLCKGMTFPTQPSKWLYLDAPQ